MPSKIKSHRELSVYQRSFDAAMSIFQFTQSLPKEETYALMDQMRRSSRSVCANLAEAWRKRRYEAAFISKLNDCESEAAETQVWLEFAVKCNYMSKDTARPLYKTYEDIIRILVHMINHTEDWVLRKK